MNIKYGGFIPTTLLDYPGEVASIIFLPGCNLKCPYCHNPSIVNSDLESLLPIQNIIDLIKKRKKLITAVIISGGEPTLYSDLDIYIEMFHGMGLKVKLDTNGTDPDILTTLKPDYIAMDIKTDLKKYPFLGFKGDIDLIEQSIKWVKASGIPYEFRTTAAPIIFNNDDLLEMIPLLKGCKNYFITNFKNSNTLIPEYNNNVPYSFDEMEEFKRICLDAGQPCTLR